MFLTSYVCQDIFCSMNWTVEIADEFEPEFDALGEDAQNEILALSRLLQQFGPQPGRPPAWTL